MLGDLENSREEKTDCVLDSYFRKENILEAIVATRDCFESSLKSSEFSEEKVAQYGRQLTIIEEMMHILEGTGDGKGRLVELAGQFQSLGELPEGVPSLPLIE